MEESAGSPWPPCLAAPAYEAPFMLAGFSRKENGSRNMRCSSQRREGQWPKQAALTGFFDFGD